MSQSVVQKALRHGTRRAVDPVTDYGPTLRLNRGDVEKVMRPDPENPNREVMGCRRVEEFRRMHQAGTIMLEHFLACERYIVTASAAMGVHDQDRCPVGRRAHWQQGHLADQQLAAMVSMRNAIAALGCSAHALVEMLVLENLPLAKIAQRRGMNPTEAKGAVRAALTRLAEHWGLAPAGGGNG
ncbi:hypothetical protein [Pseudoroseomonas ludipueritiae]|uniref:Uncharacterized protein n=1 Tax=Pseudoroseomonas ludipueritiae TaxID=198093 RepID=A0ABR7R5C5_9PROT|nr:hypothetical protein [Pseudoroseomonas ludipueritiae]MBC9176777.1 hypothetical protein [Pseudoroseomonas ludipueritiae]